MAQYIVNVAQVASLTERTGVDSLDKSRNRTPKRYVFKNVAQYVIRHWATFYLPEDTQKCYIL